MSVVLAAIDDSAAAHPVLDFARELAGVLGADLEIVHVDETGTPRTAEAVARARHLPFHRQRGEVVGAIAATAKARDAVAVVLGARGVPAGASPAGHVTLELVRLLDIGVAVVPPQARARPISRVLVAVKGDGEGEGHTLRRLLPSLQHRPELEIVALHVFEPDELPLFGDQPVLETEAWTDEARARAWRSAENQVQLELRVGDAARTLRETARELDVALVAMAWHRDLGPGHGRLVRGMLEEGDIPVFLLPVTQPAGAGATPMRA